MRYFAAIQSMLDAEKCKQFQQEHIDFLAKMVAEGRLFARGKFLDGWGGLSIFEAESLEEARALAEADPYVRHGGRKLELHEWNMRLKGH